MERKCHPARFVHWAVVLLLVVLVLPASSYAQETRGRITGRVTDATKGAIPGATVTVTDPTRNLTVTVTTNEQGLFQANFLLPGTYKVSVELTGFKTYVQENVVLQMTETRDLAIVLEVGALSESVSVTAEVSTVNTADANLGLVVDQEDLGRFQGPVSGRNAHRISSNSSASFRMPSKSKSSASRMIRAW